MQNLRDAKYFSFDTLAPHQTKEYFLTSAMSPIVGSKFQSSKLQFDTQFGLEFEPVATKKFSAPKVNSTMTAALVQPTQMPQTAPSVHEDAAVSHPIPENHCSLWTRYLPELIFALWASWFLILELRFPQYRDWMIPLLSFAFLTTALSVWYFWHSCIR